MTPFGISAATRLPWIATLSFVGVDVINVVTSAAIKDSFVRRHYPRWRDLTTGGLGILSAAFTARPAARVGGLVLGVTMHGAAVASPAAHEARTRPWR